MSEPKDFKTITIPIPTRNKIDQISEVMGWTLGVAATRLTDHFLATNDLYKRTLAEQSQSSPEAA